jgi:hypothetical protein
MIFDINVLMRCMRNNSRRNILYVVEATVSVVIRLDTASFQRIESSREKSGGGRHLLSATIHIYISTENEHTEECCKEVFERFS